MFVETKSWGMRMYTQSVIIVCTEDDVEMLRMEVTGRAEMTPDIVDGIMQMNMTLTHTKVNIVKSNLENIDVSFFFYNNCFLLIQSDTVHFLCCRLVKLKN